MKVSDVKSSETKQILDMYKESYGYEMGYSVHEFCEEILTRCECCEEIAYTEDCEMVRNWDGNILICCPNCKRRIDSDNNVELEEMGVL